MTDSQSLPGPRIVDPGSGLGARYAWSIPGFAVEHPSGGPAEIWCYTDRFSYLPGEEVGVHVHTTADRYGLRLVRDGASPEEVWSAADLPGAAQVTPADAYAAGCGWPTSVTVALPDDLRSGFYLLIASIEVAGRRYEREHFVVVKRAPDRARAPYALVLTTSTMTAYNDWGGANHYRGLGDDPFEDVPAARLSTQRPVARGMIRKPPGAPRSAHPDTPGPGFVPRHPAYEWAHAHGFSRHHADAFWATYERPFVVWAETNGYDLDYLTQHDLHADPEALDGYRCVLFVGHDEYWTAPMRDRVDDYVDKGGHVARFAGNFIWQVRLEDDATVQVCYKAPAADPLHDTAPELVTTAWDWPPINRRGRPRWG